MTNAVAAEILRQLGGSKFVAMTGAKSMSFGERSLNMRIPSSKGINAVTVKLNEHDFYNVTFSRVVKFDVNTVEYHPGVPVENLAALFERTTGLLTSL